MQAKGAQSHRDRRSGLGSGRETGGGVAIVGIGCRFPGGVTTPSEFWDLLVSGGDGISEVPPGRFDLEALYDPDPSRPGRLYARWGGFVENIDAFDADFFGISPREARRMDPQQRMLLEVVWEALEDGGQRPDRLAGSATGVFVGISGHDYADLQSRPEGRDVIDLYVNPGSAASIAANRISYVLDLRGPSLAVDTACSSALTAVHLACASLARRECDLAVVGAANALLTPEPTIGFCKGRMLSPRGHCRPFDAGADGYVRSEGAGAVVLKPLERAIADGDPIYAVVLATAVNQDGHTPGISVPNPAAQQALITETLRRAGLDPSDVQYIEAHGTGTPVGDPREAQAIGAIMAGRQRDDPCLLGSAKGNIGHLEAAAGMAGLIKAALAIQRRWIPASLHFERPHPAIAFDEWRLRVPTTLERWPPKPSGRAVAGVNAFGFGGANAHVLVAEPPPFPRAAPAATSTDDAQLLALSARSPGALADLARRWVGLLAAEDGSSMVELCAAAAIRRSHHEYRLAVVAGTRAELRAHLEAFAAGEVRADLAVGQAHPAGRPKVAFVFPGMGSQWWGTGRELLASEPVFAAALEECDQVLRPLAGWSLLEELAAAESQSRLSETQVAHAANFALQVALAALWRSWGIEPDAVVGHSSGEMAAACVAGGLNVADGCRLAYHRGRLQQRTAGSGEMLAAGIPLSAAAEMLASCGQGVSLAAVNGPASLTFSGDRDALTELAAALAERGAFHRWLPVDVPYHGPQMDDLRDELLAAVAPLDHRPPRIPLASTVTGAWQDGQPLDSEYWWANMRQPVRFAAAVDELIADGFDLFVELSPHPVLAPSLLQCLEGAGRDGTVLASLRRGGGERAAMLGTLGALYVHGREVDWTGVFGPGRHCVSLPTYPWQRERHWLEPLPEAKPRPPASSKSGHPLLGHRLRTARPTWEAALGDPALAYLDGHRVQDRVAFPASGYLEVALAATRALRGEGPLVVERVEFRRLLVLTERRDHLLGCLVGEGDSSIEIHTAPENDATAWTLRAVGRIGPRPPQAAGLGASADLAALRRRCGTAVDVDRFFVRLADRHGLRYEGAFRAVTELWTGEGEALGHIAFPPGTGASVDGYEVHPALLDAAFHVAAAAGGLEPAQEGTFVPVSVDRVELRARPGARFWAHARVTGSDGAGRRATVELLDDAAQVLLRVEGLNLKCLEAPPPAVGDWLYEERWEDAPRPTGSAPQVSAATLAAATQPLLDAHATRLGLDDYYESVEPALDALTRHYAADALAELGFDPARHTGLPAHELAGHLGVADAHMRFFARLLALTHVGGAVARALPPPAPDDLAAEHPSYRSAVELVRWSGKRLAATLRGKEDAREWMVAGQASELLRELYADNPGFAVYTETLADVVGSVAAMSRGRPLRVLEVGAGTGAATARILARFGPAPVEYLFTDVSAFFLKPARERFGDRGGFRTGVLDVENPPTDGAAFDVVVAADVVHATGDVRRTLRNLHGLLAPGGTLVLMEAARPAPWLDLVFGQFEGWWRFADADLRADHALLAVPEWLDVLDAAGFASVAAAFDGNRRPDGRDPLQAVLIATAPAATSAAARPRRRWLLLTDRHGVGPEVAATLRERGDDCTLVWPGPQYRRFGVDGVELAASSPSDWAHLLDDVGEPDALVHLWALDAPALPSASTELLSFQEVSCGSLVALTQALTGSGRSLPELWLVTGGAQPVDGEDAAPVNVGQAPLWGLGRVLRAERGSARCHLVDLGPDCPPHDVVALVEELEAPDTGTEEVALRAGRRLVRRLERLTLPQAPESASARSPEEVSFRLAVRRPGDLESLVARELLGTGPGPGEVAVRVVAGALNFRDVLVALGVGFAAAGRELTQVPLGWECAGVVIAVGEGVSGLHPGDQVIAVAAGSLGSRVVTRAELVVLKPARLSFEEAATFPVAFLTAEYALHRLGGLAPGERVLIHAAAGGVGLAAVHLARRTGAQVFATAGTPEKRAYLESLGVEHVMDSRSLDFADEVLARTGGEGVDVILNSLAGDAVARGLAILRPHGRFLEIGKRDIYEDGQLDLRPFRRNLCYLALDLHAVYDEQPKLVGSMLRSLVAEVERGDLHPLPHHDFDLADACDAFRFMAQARHTGKVVVTVRRPAYEVVGPRHQRRFGGDGTYLVTGGLGGFGLAMAHWLVAEGARHLVLVTRSGRPHPDDASSFETLMGSPADVVVLRGDVSERDDMARVLAHVRATMPSLRGVVHAAMVLDDGLLGRLDYPRFEAVLTPKLAGAWNLHELTVDDDLDLFVLFSSISSVIGQPAQANYAAGNAFLDALAAHRRANRQPVLAVNWGTIEGAGYVSRHPEIERRMRRQGLGGMAPGAACEVLGQLLTHGVARAVVSAGEWGAGRRQPAPWLANDSSGDGSDRTPAPTDGRRSRLADAPRREWSALVDRYLREAAARVLELAPERIDPDRPLFQLGLDSLMAVELRTSLRAELGVEIPIVDLLEDLSMRGLAAAVLARLEDGDVGRE